MRVYDNSFNANEWFIIVGLCVGIVVMAWLPKRFERKDTIIYFMCGVFFGFFFDHTLSVQPISYYDVNDVSKYQFFDFLSYWMYGAFSYMFFYILDCLQLKRSSVPIYLLTWSLLSTGFEWLAGIFGVFHYTNGFKMVYGFPIYLVVQSLWVAVYFRYQKTHRNIGAR